MSPVPGISESVYQQFVSILGIKNDRVVTLLEGSRPVELPPGDTLFLQGDPATAIYFLISGELSVCLEDGFGCSEIALLREGSVVGELALLSGEQRTATVTAIKASVLLEVAFTDFFALGLHHPAMIVAFFERVMPRLRETRKVELVRRSFGVPDPAWNMAIARRMTWRTRGKDEVVVERGDEADGLYLIVSGRLAVLSNGDDDTTPPVILLPGDIVGEMAVIDNLPRSATVVALRPSDLLYLSKKDFAELMGDEPKALLHLVRMLVSRERRRRSESSSAGHGSIALIPSGSVPLDAITAKAPEGAVLVDRTRLAERFGSEAFADLPGDHALAPVVRRWIEDLEASTDTLYLLGDGRGGGWDGLCRELADRTVAIQAAEDLSAEIPVARERIVVTARSVAAAAVSPPGRRVASEADGGAGPIHYYVYDGGSSARAWRVLSSTAHGVVLSGGGLCPHRSAPASRRAGTAR
ncbi:MAG: cyclic nucleotide-binding domain-containing protein [Spirochaetes bacterium]|jgi:CRP-like cAMP-binding protein|nr:cyclic nucleotide-binding domain-containing protein [Spirochaetota bacterium]